MGFASFSFGFRSFGHADVMQTQNSETEKSMQKSLTEKSMQIARVWAVLRIVNGVINVLQSAEIGGSFFVEASVNPLEFLSPLDNTLDKISNLLLWALGAILIEKLLLAISGPIVFMIVIPACALISAVSIWIFKDKAKIQKIAIVSMLISAVVPFIIPLSFQLSIVIEKNLFTNNVNSIISSIDENGKAAGDIENEISGLKKMGTSIVKFMSTAKDLGNAIIQDMINYVIIFIITNVIIPILTVFGLFGITKYFAKIIMER
jgi:hypothetical protein